MSSPMAPSYLTSSDLERSKSRLLRFQSFISSKGAESVHILLSNNKKPYIGSQVVS